MKQVILIKTTPDRYEWLTILLNSLRGYQKYPIIIFSDRKPIFPFIFPYLEADEVIFLHDSMQITDVSMFDILFETWKGKSVAFVGHTPRNWSNYWAYSMQLGKYKYDLLKKVDYGPYIRAVTERDEITKKEDGDMEKIFTSQYLALDPDPEVLLPDFHEDSGDLTDMCGRRNIRIITPYFIKYKGVHDWEKEKMMEKIQ